MRGVIHIGPPKTGTTTIQSLLRLNRTALRAAGVYVPRSRDQVHQEFRLASLQAVRKEQRSTAKWGIGGDSDLAAKQPELRELCKSWLAEAEAADCKVFVISCEGFAGMEEPSVASLHDLMRPYCRDGFTIVAFLRRQDLMANSRWATRARHFGDTRPKIGGKGLAYDALLDRWATIFGTEAVRPAIFPDSAETPIELAENFVRTAALPIADPATLQVPPRQNTAWDHRAVAVLAAVNEVLPALQDGVVTPERALVEEVLASAWEKPVPYRLHLKKARKIVRRYAESNATVARRWFGRERLFHDDFSMYDDKVQPDATPVDYARVIALLAERAVQGRGKRRKRDRGKGAGATDGGAE